MPQEKEIAVQEATFVQEDSEPPVPPQDVVAYNELRSCADLFRMYKNKKLEIQPDFQRDVVWKQDDQSRFIDSLVKQLPIPSMCFSLDYKTQQWKVIDGLQRMSSIIRFLGDVPWQLSDLSDIHPRLRSATNNSLREGDDEQKKLYALVEDVSIPVTVIRCDYSQPSHMLYLFTIFHRLNSGGVRLTNQEIRNCIYSGYFNNLLKNFDKSNADWIAVKKRIWGSLDRFRSIEVLLRVLALSEERAKYDGNLARFLNEFMHRTTGRSNKESDALLDRLSKAVFYARQALSKEGRRKLPLVLVEALMVGLYSNLSSIISSYSPENLQAGYAKMVGDASFSESARYAVTSVDNVRTRLMVAVNAFSA